ncbi:MAG: hypothetical protein KBF82_03000 [Chitinophagaceae bacterium]|nr:hypothetical protein [Chitinophagaceae bacterium]
MDMKAKIGLQIKELEIFLMNDQPFSCPHCGTRCEELANFYHTNSKLFVQQCLNIECNFICFEEEDEYFLKLWGVI